MRDDLEHRMCWFSIFFLVELKAMRVRSVCPQLQCYRAKDGQKVLATDRYLGREWRHQRHTQQPPSLQDAEEHALRAKGGSFPFFLAFIIKQYVRVATMASWSTYERIW